ncbi:MAG: hypothetical protein J6Y48_03790 [Clostridia bacterium]|nr:hypothetical protein [Oscillospiraceae bacterium]MBP5726178.1 hypothetical protein [Clostridia bacterium]
MAYYNGFPATYQPVYPVQGYAQQQTQNNGIIWVSGEAGAKAYMVAPNNTIQLWDSESQTIYLKSADASGMPSMKILDYTIRDSLKNSPNTAPVLSDDKLSAFATKDEIKAVSDRITAISERLDKMEVKK